MRATPLLALLVAAVACSGCTPAPRDEDVASAPEEVAAFARARALTTAEGAPGLPLRRMTYAEKLLPWMPVPGFPGLGVRLPDVGALFGFSFEPRALYLREQNALLLLHRGRAPTVLPLDPERPVADPERATPEPVYQWLRARIARDLEGVPIEPERPRPPAGPAP